MKLINIDQLERDTEWSEYYDGYISYSQLQIDNTDFLQVEEDDLKLVEYLLESIHSKILKGSIVKDITEEEIGAFIYVKGIIKKLNELKSDIE